nr:hypothetical protein Iba_chr05eCG11020 [Ipomoea batatas]
MWERSWVETQAILLQNENSPSISKGNDEFVSKDVGNETQKEERKRGNDDAILFEPNHGKILEGVVARQTIIPRTTSNVSCDDIFRTTTTRLLFDSVDYQSVDSQRKHE